MEKIALLKEKANNKECSHCGKVAVKYVAPSIAINNMYYSTCSCCGNVETAEENETLDGVFVFNSTPNSNGSSVDVKLMMEDAKASYKAMSTPVKYSCVTEEEADEYKEALKEEIQEWDDYEDDYEDMNLDVFGEEEYETYIIINKDTRLSLVARVKNLDELTEIVENTYMDSNISIFKTSHELTISKKVVLGY